MAIPVGGLLTEPRLSRLLRRYTRGSELVGYTSSPSSSPGATFIDRVFRWLDPKLRLDFQRRGGLSGSAISIREVERIGRRGRGTIGITDSGPERFDVQWKDLNGRPTLSWVEQAVIIHEIGHTLGLSHPYDKPWARAYDTRDTIMSYNNNRSRDPWFTASDLAALRRIWGQEASQARMRRPSPTDRVMAYKREGPGQPRERHGMTQAWDDDMSWWGCSQPVSLEGWSSG